MRRLKIPVFSSRVKKYNCYCTKCGWKGLSRKLLIEEELPDQCTRCHQAGTLREKKL